MLNKTSHSDISICIKTRQCQRFGRWITKHLKNKWMKSRTKSLHPHNTWENFEEMISQGFVTCILKDILSTIWPHVAIKLHRHKRLYDKEILQKLLMGWWGNQHSNPWNNLKRIQYVTNEIMGLIKSKSNLQGDF